MARKDQLSPKFNVTMPDAFSRDEVRVVVAFDAAASGKSFSQALVDLVIEEADVESYPDAMRERIAELREALRDEAAQHALGDGG